MQLSGFVNASEVLRAGVYALVLRGVVIYVGKSKSMLGRIYSHRNLWAQKRKRRSDVPTWLLSSIPGIHFDEIHVRPCLIEDLDRLEAEMIELYKPRYNTQLKTARSAQAEVALTIRGVPIRLNAKPEPTARIERRV